MQGRCSFLLLISLVVAAAAAQEAAAQLADKLTMAALQRELGVPEWVPAGHPDYCSWLGVSCSGGRVEALELPRRTLRGNISLVSRLASLRRLDLSGNALGGPIPAGIGDLPAIEYLDLSMNLFDSRIPPSLGRAGSLTALNLSNCLLTGEIPDELRSLERLQELQISGNNLYGLIPSWVGELAELTVFSAYENQLTGAIPGNLGSASGLQVLNLHSNRLEGAIPGSIFSSGKLEALILTMNNLSGIIPESIGNCRGLSSVRIGNNQLAGRIPRSIGNVGSLTYFEADSNRISGDVPPEFANCANLTLLNLASNRITGSIPPEFGDLNNLQELIFSGNGLSGKVPRPILRCRNLSKLDLSDNSFNGSLPEDLCLATKLQFLLLNQNLISGEIPPEIGNCGRLLELELGSNHLSGNIPPEVGRLKNLQISLNLSFNYLQGPLPKELGRLDKLVSLDVSNNKISGALPPELRGMLSLIEVNFSNNQFQGQIPAFAPFQKSPGSSFSANKELCGDPLNVACDGYPGFVGGHHKVSYKTVLAVVGSGLAVFAAVSVVVALFMLKEKELADKPGMAVAASSAARGFGGANPPAVVAGDMFDESLKQAVDFVCVVKATMCDSNLLRIGAFSVVYKAVMPSGLILLVRKLKSEEKAVSTSDHQSKMAGELQRLGKISHSNLLRPIGYVIHEDAALLLHPYMPNGTLAQLLHGDGGQREQHEPDWPRRLSIATAAAEGLAFLHNTAIIHLDVSSCNIYLDANYNAFLGEVEVSMLLDPSRGATGISAVAGSFGYIPPEYAYSMQVTAPGNVYSFGVVLLELLTTRLPVDEEAFGEGMDLVKWVHSAPERGESPEQIMDARLSTVSYHWRKHMLATLRIALLCTNPAPARRPRMKKVLEMLLQVVEAESP